MRVLLIKTSSMGDLIHTLPALTDAGSAIPGIKFDWLVEEGFTDIPAWHPLVERVIPVALRRWRKQLFSKRTRVELAALKQQLAERQYDVILDAQGLVKSALLTLLTRGKRAGLDWGSAREALASLFYQQKCQVNFKQHAVIRMRSLFSLALNYPLPLTPPDFGLTRQQFQLELGATEKYLVFLHGTTWETKQWPEDYWVSLAKLAAQQGYRVKMSGGNAAEIARAERIGASCAVVDVLPRLEITQMATWLASASGVVAVDTGFGHLAAALGVPVVSLYGATNPDYTSALGKKSLHLAAQFPCSPCLSRICTYRLPSEVKPACYATLQPVRVWMGLQSLLGQQA
jgi:heptosyltransferase-1